MYGPELASPRRSFGALADVGRRRKTAEDRLSLLKDSEGPLAVELFLFLLSLMGCRPRKDSMQLPEVVKKVFYHVRLRLAWQDRDRDEPFVHVDGQSKALSKIKGRGTMGFSRGRLNKVLQSRN